MLLHDWKNGDDAHSNAQDQVEGDKELVQLAFTNIGSSVVGIAQDARNQCDYVKKHCRRQQCPKPV